MTEESTPLVVWDADCGFCRLWIEHWSDRVRDGARFRPLQELSEDEFEELGFTRAEAEEAMHLVDGEGVWSGATAVMRLLARSVDLRHRMIARAFEAIPPFRVLADAVYRRIASDRALASRLTKFLWGVPHRSTFHLAQAIGLRGLAIAAFLAFWSMHRQILGLIGTDGILPANDYLTRVSEVSAAQGWSALGLWHRVPTLFHWGAQDAVLEGTCIAGMIGAAALFIGLAPRLLLPVLWFLYLSICSVGQVFLGYQWDALLLEALVLAWFFSPWTVAPRAVWKTRTPLVGRWLVWLLVFKLMIMAGLVKVATDPVWSSLSALDYHFWTQPIPNNVSYWIHRLPDWMKAGGVVFTLVAELVAPLLVFAPRRLRHAGAIAMIALQLMIGFTGTYGFFNILTIALCLTLFDDRAFRFEPREAAASTRLRWSLPAALVLIPLVLLPIDSRRIYAAEHGELRQKLDRFTAPLRTFNSYGLFGHMTKQRHEVVLEVSADGENWETIDFRWKPTAIDEPLRFTTLHMPRLDWQMWFAALGTCERNQWYLGFVEGVLAERPEVLALLEAGPATRSPVFARSRFWAYEPALETTWQRRLLGDYCPTLRWSDGRLQVAHGHM